MGYKDANWMETKDSETPLVSVVMPVKNVENTVRESIDSILNQTVKNLELIVVDDDSTDGTRSIVDTYQKHDSRVTVLSSRGQGISDARNSGLAIVRAPLYAVMDADDIASQDRLELQIDEFEKKQKLVLLGSFYHVFEENISNLTDTIVLPVENEKLKLSILSFPTFGHPTVMVKTEAIREVEGYRKAFEGAEDHDLYLRLSKLGEFGVLPKFLMYYRSHSNQFSRVKKAMGYRASVAAVYCNQHAQKKCLENPTSVESCSELALEMLTHASESRSPLTKDVVNVCARAVQGLAPLPEYADRVVSLRRRIAGNLLIIGKFKLAVKFWKTT